MPVREKERNRKSFSICHAVCIIGALVIIAALLAFAWFSTDGAFFQSKQQAAYTLRDNIRTAAMQCFAIEGQYPPSVEHIEEHYGIAVNDDDYEVIYEVYAPNVPPVVEVRVK